MKFLALYKKLYKNINPFSKFLLITSWTFSIVSLLIVFFRVEAHITHESFIGLGITIIGVLVTFAVGFQIYNLIDIKQRLDSIRTVENKYNDLIKANEAIKTKQNELYYTILESKIILQNLKKALALKEENYKKALHCELEKLITAVKYKESAYIKAYSQELSKFISKNKEHLIFANIDEDRISLGTKLKQLKKFTPREYAKEDFYKALEDINTIYYHL